MRVKRAILKELARRYQRGRKKDKTRVLEQFIGLTGYNRSYGSWLLRNCGQKVILSGGDRPRVVFIGEVRPIRRRRDRVYDEEFKRVLVWVWELLDSSCGKRLVGSLRWLVPRLVEQRELRVKKAVQQKLLQICAATSEDADPGCLRNRRCSGAPFGKREDLVR